MFTAANWWRQVNNKITSNIISYFGHRSLFSIQVIIIVLHTYTWLCVQLSIAKWYFCPFRIKQSLVGSLYEIQQQSRCYEMLQFNKKRFKNTTTNNCIVVRVLHLQLELAGSIPAAERKRQKRKKRERRKGRGIGDDLQNLRTNRRLWLHLPSYDANTYLQDDCGRMLTQRRRKNASGLPRCRWVNRSINNIASSTYKTSRQPPN